MPPDFAGRPFDTFEFARTHHRPPPDTGPVPPSLHWALLVVLTVVSLGLFSWVWLFVQARFIKKIHRVGYGLFWLTAWTTFCLILIAAAFQRQIGFVVGFRWLATGCYLAGLFSMKASMESYYNRIENIGLQLNGVLVYFFSVFYFQYHFHRIAVWRRTGILA